VAQSSRQRRLQDEARQSVAEMERMAVPINQPRASNRVVIGVPCGDMVSAYFAYDLARLVGYTAMHVPDTSLQILFHHGTLIAPQRQDIAKASVAAEATHILWLDADMRFPKQSLEGLLKQDVDIVGANYIRRRPPHYPTAWAKGNYLWTYEDSEGLVEVDHVGMGLMLTKTRVFEETPMPWFQIPWVEERGTYRGEDITFMEAARNAGFKVYVDQSLSWFVQHTGTMEYSHIHGLDAAEFERRMKEAEDGADNKLLDSADGDSELAEQG